MVNKQQRACTGLGDHGEDSALPTLWDSLPAITVIGGQSRGISCLMDLLNLDSWVQVVDVWSTSKVSTCVRIPCAIRIFCVITTDEGWPPGNSHPSLSINLAIAKTIPVATNFKWKEGRG
ncbi:hypothetical protein NE237_019465 [Protea cynaroides]|uniref:Uncharacterized protein n=1 Tax=Protea cynaroides TaxID=273540 RepID=A0A9Q0KBU6_9MAGN|nr:hypothetical protein NE237_019465 [Protea cynaroides]